MSLKTALPISSCWVITEGLAGLRNQGIGLAQALGVDFILKEIPTPKGFWQRLFPPPLQLQGPWPDLLITCGRRSVAAALAVRKASGAKTFTVHIQDPAKDPKLFDVVIVPQHDRVRGENVLVTKGSVHQVTREKLDNAAWHFKSLLTRLPRPWITVLIGGKNKHQGFTGSLARDLVQKLQEAVQRSRGGLAVTTSRRTGEYYEAVFKQGLAKAPCYFWDGRGENPYFGLLALADVIVVTSDSVSMVSEACSTGKPVYLYEMPGGGGRHRQFCDGLVRDGHARYFKGVVEGWPNQALEETRRAAEFIAGRYSQERRP